ncbi:hypothetical protein LCGC14_2366190 [marine sediment metagenome]|uniref:Uncharacterized protein n=1 Tax=marine sediment metagenome TaxID=412755 RepID=A0A0F9C5D7_9ZZZZ
MLLSIDEAKFRKQMKASADLRKIIRRQEKEFKIKIEAEQAAIQIEKDNYGMSAAEYWKEQVEEAKKGSQRLKVARIRLDLGGSLRETPNVGPDSSEEFIRPKTADLERYKEKVKKGYFKDNLRREMREIEILMENEHETYTRHDWDYLYKRWNKVHTRIHNPTARFSIAGAVPGKLPKEKQQEVNQREAIKNLLNFSKKELENAKRYNFSRLKT